MLDIPVIHTGNDISGHVDQEDAMNPNIKEILEQNLLNTIQMFLIQCIRHAWVPSAGRCFSQRPPRPQEEAYPFACSS
jgi:hypothetical protein